MLLWTNDGTLSRTPVAAQHSLELWLCQFRDLEFSELLTGACDLALVNDLRQVGVLAVPYVLRLVVVREPGCYEQLLQLWHQQTQPHYPHLGLTITGSTLGGSGGYAPPPQDDPTAPITRRYRLWAGSENASVVDAVDLLPAERYGDFCRQAKADGLQCYGVEVEDSRKELRLVEPQGRYQHQPFSLSIE